jgi:hypothetical protein
MVIYYAPTIFEQAGFQSAECSIIATACQVPHTGKLPRALHMIRAGIP